jgi:hypothetical protein
VELRETVRERRDVPGIGGECRQHRRADDATDEETDPALVLDDVDDVRRRQAALRDRARVRRFALDDRTVDAGAVQLEDVRVVPREDVGEAAAGEERTRTARAQLNQRFRRR